MKIKGIDFTSKPTAKKPITCAICEYTRGKLVLTNLKEFVSYHDFEEELHDPSEWYAGFDFPFGLARKFIENIGWPNDWEGYISYVNQLSRDEFVTALEEYKKHRAAGDKEHRRVTDVIAQSISPQKLFGVPVGKMFYEGAKRLLNAPVNVLPFQQHKASRYAIEAYPALIARRCIQKQPYKNDTRAKQTKALYDARKEIVLALEQGELAEEYGFELGFSQYREKLIEDATGDSLDAFMCAIQAAWVYSQKHNHHGIPDNIDLLEGWIPDPALK